MLGWLAQLGIGTIVNKLAVAYEAKQRATTDQARIAADTRIKTLEARRDVMAAEAGNPLNAIVRALFALPVALYYGKIFLWDKTLGLGTTDALSPELTKVAMIVIGFYFLYDGGSTIARIIKRR